MASGEKCAGGGSGSAYSSGGSTSLRARTWPPFPRCFGGLESKLENLPRLVLVMFLLFEVAQEKDQRQIAPSIPKKVQLPEHASIVFDVP